MNVNKLLEICVFRYEVNKSGVLVVKNKYRSSREVGEHAGSLTKAGYICIGVMGKLYQAHRIVWLINNKCLPKGEIDHIDGNKQNNSIENLRDVDRSNNMRNQKVRLDNSSGCIGVHFDSESEKWRAKIIVNQKNIPLGRFENKGDAISARKKAEIKYNFHKNHGRTS